MLAAARYVAPPLGEEGVARMIETLVLAPPDEARAAVGATGRGGDGDQAARTGGAVSDQVEVAVEA